MSELLNLKEMEEAVGHKLTPKQAREATEISIAQEKKILAQLSTPDREHPGEGARRMLTETDLAILIEKLERKYRVNWNNYLGKRKNLVIDLFWETADRAYHEAEPPATTDSILALLAQWVYDG